MIGYREKKTWACYMSTCDFAVVPETFVERWESMEKTVSNLYMDGIVRPPYEQGYVIPCVGNLTEVKSL
jgi:hypothetical protein